MAKTIAFFNTKGGVGKTSIAINLALSLSATKHVCLLDLDLDVVGDMAAMMGLKPQKSLLDYLIAVKNKGEGLKKDDFATRFSKSLDFFPAVLKAESGHSFDAEYLEKAHSFFKGKYDYIIMDCGQNFNSTTINALNQANLILLVLTPDIPAINQTRRVMEILQDLRFPARMMKLVLNRAESVSSLSWQEIKVAFSCDILAKIPSEGNVAMQAVNQGIPILINSPRSKFTLNINKLANEILSNNELFVEHIEINREKAKEIVLDRSREFWDKMSGSANASAAEAVLPAGLEAPEKEDEVTLLKRRIHDQLIEELNIKKISLGSTVELRKRAEHIVTNLLAAEGKFIPSQEMREGLLKEIIDEALGLGPLEMFLRDEAINDIMINNKDEIYIERHGKMEHTNKKFISNEQIKTVIERILAPLGRRIDESVPMVDARLSDGSRVNAIIPPLSLAGPTLTIRKFKKEKFKTEELVKLGALSNAMVEFLRASVISRKNIIVSGGTGSGKTTVLNLFSGFIPNEERIITIEDAAELKLDQEHWVRLESRPPNIEGKGAVTIRDLFRNTLRMRPDRIIVGECRGLEALDMLQAMNTGHDGSMTTLHANSAADVLIRLDSLILMSGVELPIRAIREMITSAIDMIVHTARLSDGSRKITQVTEIAGMSDETHVNLKDIFVFRRKGLDSRRNVIGEFSSTGYIPSFIEDIRIRGIPLSDEIFKAGPNI